jgi:hypothetical protein
MCDFHPLYAAMTGYVQEITLFDESDTIRRGFFEPVELSSVIKHLPDHLRPLAQFAYYCGWRKAELTNRRVRNCVSDYNFTA